MARSIVRAVCVLALTHALAHAWVSHPAPRPTVLRSAPTDSPADVDAAPGADRSAGPLAELDLARAAEAIPPPSPSSGNPVWQLDLVRAEALCVAAGATPLLGDDGRRQVLLGAAAAATPPRPSEMADVVGRGLRARRTPPPAATRPPFLLTKASRSGYPG